MKITKANIKKHLPQIKQNLRHELADEPSKIKKSALEMLIAKKAQNKAGKSQQTANQADGRADNSPPMEEKPQVDLARIRQIEEEMEKIRDRREREWQERLKADDQKKEEEEKKKDQEVFVMPTSKRPRGMLGGVRGPVDKNKKGELKSG